MTPFPITSFVLYNHRVTILPCWSCLDCTLCDVLFVINIAFPDVILSACWRGLKKAKHSYMQEMLERVVMNLHDLLLARKAGLQTWIKLPAFATLNTETQQQQRTTSCWSFKPFLINSRSLCRARRKLHVVCLFVCLFLFPMHIPWFVFNHHAHLGKLCSSLKQPLYKARFATEIIIEPVLQLFSPFFMLSLSSLLVSAPFHVTSLQFHPDGNILMLLGKDQMCLCFLTDPRT